MAKRPKPLAPRVRHSWAGHCTPSRAEDRTQRVATTTSHRDHSEMEGGMWRPDSHEQRAAVPQGSRQSVRPAGVHLLIALLLLLAVNALAGGAALVAEPSGRLLGMPVSLLAGSPFEDYLVPGVIL